MRAQITMISDSLGIGRISFTLYIYCTKFAQAKHKLQKYKAVLGDSHTNHFINLGGISDEEVK